MASRFWGRLLIGGATLLQMPFRGKRIKSSSVRKVLVVNHLLLGDTLMLTPLLKAIRLHYPDALIKFACPVGYVSLYSQKPYGVDAIGFDLRSPTSLWNLILYQRGYDIAFVPGDNRWSWLAAAMGSRWIVAFSGDKKWKNFPVDELVEFPNHCAAWGDISTHFLPVLPDLHYLSSDWIAPPCKDFLLPNLPYIVLHLGASKFHKYWHSDNWIALAEWIRKQGICVVWSAGKNERQLVNNVSPSIVDIDYSGQLDLNQMWHLLKGAKALVCPDTGIAHLGRVVGVPTVTLFGPGSPLISGAGMFWEKSPYLALWDESVACRNQTLLFERDLSWVRHCWRDVNECLNPSCMEKINISCVINGLKVLAANCFNCELIFHE